MWSTAERLAVQCFLEAALPVRYSTTMTVVSSRPEIVGWASSSNRNNGSSRRASIQRTIIIIIIIIIIITAAAASAALLFASAALAVESWCLVSKDLSASPAVGASDA